MNAYKYSKQDFKKAVERGIYIGKLKSLRDEANKCYRNNDRKGFYERVGSAQLYYFHLNNPLGYYYKSN